MDNNVLNSLVLYRSKWFSDLVEERKISEVLMTKPTQMTSTLSYIFGMYEGAGNVLDLLTSGIGRTVTIESNDYEWDVMIDHDRAITIRDAKVQGSAIASTDTPGINGQPIQLWLEDKWFGPGAIIAFDDRNYIARVEGEPYQDGTEWVYTVVVADGQPDSYILPALLAAGKQVSREGSAYEEGSEQADIVNYMTPFKLRNRLNILRLSYDITGSAYSTVMVIEMKVPGTNKSTKYWADYQEWVALKQWYKTIDRWLVYSKHNGQSDGTTMLKGGNGRPVYTGAGLLQQIAPSNTRYFTTLTLGILEDFMSDLSYNILDKGNRKFVALTGEMGLREFDRVIRDKVGTLLTGVESKFISGSGQELVLGGQFTTYRWLNGMEMTVKHLPLFDDVVLNRKLHPISGKPLESYRYMILDIGMRGGEPNLVKVVRKDREMVMAHTAGLVAPGVGHAKSIGTLRSNAKDMYSVHFLSECGIMLKDPTTSGQLICDAE
jgi:hypothetical protein